MIEISLLVCRKAIWQLVTLVTRHVLLHRIELAFRIGGATMDATERDRHDATTAANNEDTSIWPWSSAHLDERRIRWRFMFNSQVVNVWVLCGIQARHWGCGVLYSALSKAFPADRFGFAQYQQDGVIPDFSYTAFVPSIKNETNAATATAARSSLFHMELERIRRRIEPLSNFGYYLPWSNCGFIHDHTMSVLYSGTKIRGNGQDMTLENFVNDVTSFDDPVRKPVIKVFENDQSALGNWDFFTGIGAWITKLVSS
ncbi:hypothetical protein ACN8ZM_32605 [Burkholderia aenigmatica]|uniref:hypothetical protein n=1 Tax=Burkholderia aenigmatica TaxID=2015348 RepID=UPI003B42B109